MMQAFETILMMKAIKTPKCKGIKKKTETL